MNKAEFGQFIAEIRREMNLTQQALAEKLHVTDKAVSKWERGLSYPDVTLLEPLATVLQLSVSELMTCKKISDTEESEATARSLLDIAKQSQRRRGRKAAFAAALVSLFAVMLVGTILLLACASKEYTINTTVLTKQQETDGSYIFIETETGVLRLRCSVKESFDEIIANGKQYYQIDYRWNRLTERGTLCSFSLDAQSLGTEKDQIGSSISVGDLLGYEDVWMEYIYVYKDPQRPDSYLKYLGFYCLNDGRDDYEVNEDGYRSYLLKVEDCRSILLRDHDSDGIVELFVLTNDNLEQFRIYDKENGSISVQIRSVVAPDIAAELQKNAQW